MLQLERELVQARLKEAESQCALKEMQDKILDMEKVGVQECEALLQLQPSPCVTTRPIVLCHDQGCDGVGLTFSNNNRNYKNCMQTLLDFYVNVLGFFLQIL